MLCGLWMGWRRWGGTKQIQLPIRRNHWGPLGFLLPGEINHASLRLLGPLPSTESGWTQADLKQCQEGGGCVWLHPALPRILPSHSVTSQTPVSSPHASLMVDISLRLSSVPSTSLNSSSFPKLLLLLLPHSPGHHPLPPSPTLSPNHQSLVSYQGRLHLPC